MRRSALAIRIPLALRASREESSSQRTSDRDALLAHRRSCDCHCSDDCPAHCSSACSDHSKRRHDFDDCVPKIPSCPNARFRPRDRPIAFFPWLFFCEEFRFSPSLLPRLRRRLRRLPSASVDEDEPSPSRRAAGRAPTGISSPLKLITSTRPAPPSASNWLFCTYSSYTSALITCGRLPSSGASKSSSRIFGSNRLRA